MANTTIKIKRSSANSAPASLLEGELAYSFVSNTLFIGSVANTPITIATANTTDTSSSANTVRVSLNGTGALSRKQLNLVDSSDVLFSLSDSLDGNANVSASVTSNLFVEVLRANGWIDFTKTDVALEPSHREGRVWYNANTKTLQVKSLDPSFDTSVGDTLWFYGMNITGSTIPKGTPVYITGVDLDPTLGNIAIIDLADASDVNKKDVIGITAHDIIDGNFGHVVLFGYVRGINTSILTTGGRVHLDWSNPGKLVTESPAFPNYPMEIGRCILSDAAAGVLFVDIIDHSFERLRVSEDAYFDGNVTVAMHQFVLGQQTITGNIYGQFVHSSGVDLLPAIRSAANTTQVYANGTVRVSNAALNFNNTSTIRVDVTSNGNGRANISFDYIGESGGIASFPTKATGGTVVSANGLNFVNSATVGITVTPGITGNANISFTTLSGGGTVTQVDTGIGLSGGGFTTSGTISANIASTTVQGVTKLIDVVTSTDAANAATANSVKVAFDRASSSYTQANLAYAQANTATAVAQSAYGQANLAYTQANTGTTVATSSYAQANSARDQANSAYSQANLAYTQANTGTTTAQAAYGQANAAFAAANNAANTVRVTSNSGSTQSAVSLNFINTASVQVSVGAGTAGNANVGFSVPLASPSVTGIVQLNDTVINNSTTMAPTANAVKATYDFAATKYSSTGGTISGDVTITGNLILLGGTSQLNVTNLSVNDSIILLGSNNISDVLDIGFVGHYRRGATDTHAGIIRKATDKTFYVFDNYEVEPTNNVIDITGNNFRLGNVRLGVMNANSILVLGTSVATVTDVGVAYGQANAAFAAANNAANTTRVSANSGSTLSNVSLNFVNTATVQVSVTSGGTGVANIAFTSLVTGGGGGTLNNFPVSVNTGSTVSANGLNFTNSATVTVSVTPGINGNANVSFTSVGGTATPGGSNTQIQFNNNGTLGASSKFTYNTAPNLVSVDADLKLANTNKLYFGGEQANNNIANSKFSISFNVSATSLDFTFLG